MNELAREMPSTLSGGTTVKYRRSFPGYPASAGWALKVYLSGAVALNVTATADGDEYEVEITAAQTGTLTPGNYALLERVEKAGEVYDVARGVVQVTANLATATAGSGVTHAERTLAVIEAALEGRLTADVESYQIAGRAVSKIPVRDLLALRQRYKGEVAIERSVGSGGSPFGNVNVCFGGAR